MSIRPIIAVPDARLKTISKPVAAVADDTRALIDDMFETMYAAGGIGLAAIQIGVPQRVIVMDLRPRAGRGDDKADRYDLSAYADEAPRCFVNPEILWASEETRNYQEGCLSVPDFYDDVERPAQCRIGYLDRDGEAHEIDCDDLLATCIQHEIDHLNGIVFLDHLSRLKRERTLKKLQKIARDAAIGA